MAEPPDPLRELRREVPPGLEAVVMRCLEKDAQRRFPDVAALAQALAPFGQADARTAAARIGRVVRAKQPSIADLGGAGATTTVNPSRAEIAQTAAAFGTTEPTSTSRPGKLPFVAGAAVLAVLGIVAIVATRGAPAESPRPTGAASLSPTTPGASPSPGPTSASTAASAVAPAPTETVVKERVEPAVAVASAAPASASTAPVAPATAGTPSPAPTHAHAKPKPAASSAPAGPAKPAATSAFGGRD